MKPCIWIGIDPGLTGAIARIDPHGVADTHSTPVTALHSKGKKVEGKTTTKTKKVFDMPGMHALLQSLLGEPVDHCDTFITIECAAPHPGEGVSAAFNYGAGYGVWLGLITASRRPFGLIRPHVWRPKMVGAKTSKEQAVIVVNQLWPHLELKKTEHGKAEALLIALYASRYSLRADPAINDTL